MSKQRPKTAISSIGKPVKTFKGISDKSGPLATSSRRVLERPASAKEKFEFCNQRRNEDAWKQQDLEAAVQLFKKREWQTKYYNELSGPKYMEDRIQETKMREKKEKQLNERRKRLIQLFKNDEIKYESERQKKLERQKSSTTPSIFYPEVEILKSRLQELKHKNEQEYKKMSEKLSYEAWRKNNPEIRQMESGRLNKFVQEAWIDQKKWKEDEREKQTEERRKFELEALKEAREQEEKLRKEETEKHEKLIAWRKDLDEQISLLEEKEKEEIALSVKEKSLEGERRYLNELIQRRDGLKELRKRKEIELFWAAQFQLKLKKKASHIQNELTEDEQIIEDLLRKHPEDPILIEDKSIEEAKWMKHVLEEQRKLEIMREKEYDLLFTEDAEKMWHQRQADWQREQNARDKLMQEVMIGLQKQVDEKLSSTLNCITETKNEKTSIMSSIQEKQCLIEGMSYEAKEHCTLPMTSRKMQSFPPTIDKDLQINQQIRKLEMEEHRKEISRLEDEMKKLWEESYVPPQFGRKKVNW